MTFNYNGLIKRTLALVFVLFILFFVAQSTILPGIIEQALKQNLADNGFPVQSLEMRAVSWTHADFAKVVLGKDSNVEIDSLQTDYDIYSLIKGRVKTIRISGAQFTTQWNRRNILSVTRKAYISGQQTGLPFDKIDISSSSLLFMRGKSRFRIPFEGHIEKDQDRISYALDAELLGGFATVKGAATANFDITDLHTQFSGLDTGLLPFRFLPPFMTSPLQGHLQGTLDVTRKGPTWHSSSDLSIRLAGEYNHRPFQISQARFIGHATFDSANCLKTIQADVSIEQARFSRYAVQNLSASVTNDAQHIKATVFGHGTDWDFQRADIALSNFPDLMKMFCPQAQASGEIPHTQATISNFHNRINKVRTSIQSIEFNADLLRTQNGLRFSDAEVKITDGMLAQNTMLIQGISGTLHIDEFVPFTTKGSQQLEIAQAKFGSIELQDGKLLLKTDKPGRFLIERCDWVWCGGRITGRPFHFDTKSPETKITAFFEDISFSRLLSVAMPGKIKGNALLYGRIPVRLRVHPNMTLTFGKGNLYSVPSYGKLSIQDPSIIRDILMGAHGKAKSDPASLRSRVSAAVANYHYNILKIDLERIHANGLAGEIQMRGHGAPSEELPLGLNIPIHVK